MSASSYVYIAAILVIIAGFVAWDIHERDVGEAKIRAADAAATLRVQAAAKVQTIALAAQAAKAQKDAANAQATLNAYMVQFPVGDVRVCHADTSGGSVPQAPTVTSSAAAASPRPVTLPAVPAAAAGPNIGPGLAILVQAAARLAIDEREFQQRQVGAP